MTSVDPAATVDPATREVLLKSLERSDQPLTALQLSKQLTGPFRLPMEPLNQVLEAEVARGTLYRFAPYRSKASRYWTRDLAQYARVTIRKAVADRPRTRSELKNALAAPLRGLGEKQRQDLLGRMLADGEICEHPALPRSRTTRLGIGPPEPKPYFRDTVVRVQKIVASLKEAGLHPNLSLECLQTLLEESVLGQSTAAGVTSDDPPLRAAEGGTAAWDSAVSPRQEPTEEEVPPERLEQLIFDAMRAVQPGADAGALVTARELRQAPQLRLAAKKTAVDAAVLRLAEQGRLALHRHDFPSSLNEEDRGQLVTDGRGNYYVGVAMRRRHGFIEPD